VLYHFVQNTRHKDNPCPSNRFATYLVDIKIKAVAYNWERSLDTFLSSNLSSASARTSHITPSVSITKNSNSRISMYAGIHAKYLLFLW